ncbi:MAG: TIM-barrel domain-containing protein, partial [Anaerolineales bacterium]
KRGQKIHLWPEEVYNNTSSGAYKNIPFFMSTRGYGMFINTSFPVTVRIGDLTAAALSLIVDYAPMLDTYLIYGPTLKQILKRYTQITGDPQMPPKWSFGHWMGRITYTSQEEVERTARELRAHRIPTDVMHIDTGWFKTINNCDLEFDPVRFPDPAGMTARLKEMGFHLSLWQTCNIPVNNSLYLELKDIKGLVLREQGVPYNRPGYEDDCGMPDLTNPEVVAFLQEKYRKLFRQGVSAIKVDFGEGAPPDGVYHRFPSRAMRCLYPLLYNKLVFEVSEEFFGKGNALIWARSAWAGSQRYPLHWSGDGSATWRDLPCTLRSGLSLGLSGFVFWSHDIGGFIGNPTPELYSRWVQLAAFTSHARAHGEPPREPWYYGERAEAIYRRYMELRYRLIPYIYSQAVECVRQSLPMLRALVLEFQDDPTVATIEDEYLFGDSFLVAPIMTPSNERMVYLPEGQWIDYWSKRVVPGNRWLKVKAPLEKLPLWVRAGSIIPMGPVQQFVDEKPLDPLSVELYLPTGEKHFVIYDSRNPEIHVQYRQHDSNLGVEISPTVGQVELFVYGLSVGSATINKNSARITPIDGGSLICFDGRSGSQIELVIS